jgi:hypothetical protein
MTVNKYCHANLKLLVFFFVTNLNKLRAVFLFWIKNVVVFKITVMKPQYPKSLMFTLYILAEPPFLERRFDFACTWVTPSAISYLRFLNLILANVDPPREHRVHVRLEFRTGLVGSVHRVGRLLYVFLWFLLSEQREREGAIEQRTVHNARCVMSSVYFVGAT